MQSLVKGLFGSRGCDMQVENDCLEQFLFFFLRITSRHACTSVEKEFSCQQRPLLMAQSVPSLSLTPLDWQKDRSEETLFAKVVVFP